MSLLFSCSRRADESRIKRPQAFARCGLPGSKCIRMKNARPASPGTSKTEPNIRHGEAASVVPCEKHAACCETTTASRENSPRKTANEKQGGTILPHCTAALVLGDEPLRRACRCILPSCARCG